MTLIAGNLIDDADFNNLLATVNQIYGTGNRDRGYGQTTITQPPVTVAGQVRSTNWTNLTHMIATCATHQGTPTNLPPDSLLATGQSIKAWSGITSEFLTDKDTTDKPLGLITAGSYSIPNYVTAIDANRFNLAPTALSVATNVWSVIRSTTWSNNITTEVSATWASEDTARFFFNSGGQIRMHGSHPTGTPQDTKWSNTLTGIGLIALAMHATTGTGTAGAQTVGYYELTDAYRTIYTNRPPGSYATSTTVLIEAKRLGFVGLNGANGKGVQFRVTLAELGFYVNAITAAGTNFGLDTIRATTFLAGITAPAYATVDPFN